MFVADLVLVLVMVATSASAALVLPPDGMLPVDLGAGPGLSWMPKSVALVLWPAIGVVAYLATRPWTGVGRLDVRSQVGLTVALALMLLVQIGSVLVAINRRGHP